MLRMRASHNTRDTGYSIAKPFPPWTWTALSAAAQATRAASTFAIHAAQQILRLHLEAVKTDLVFLHAAIADDLDLGPRHSRRREWFVLTATGLFREQHGKPAVPRLVRVGAHQKRHQIRTHRMRDPGLVAVNLID